MDVETNGESTSNRPNENNSGNETGFRKFRSFRIPVKVGEEYNVKIEAMSKRDEVKIKITRVGMGYAIADVVQQ